MVVRPSYVLGGRAMAVVYDDDELAAYFQEQVPKKPEHPILIDKFLEHAIEVDVDALSDGNEVYVAGIMEHIEEAGIHSGDSACVFAIIFAFLRPGGPRICRPDRSPGPRVRVVGLMNIQFAIRAMTFIFWKSTPGPRARRPCLQGHRRACPIWLPG